MLYLLVDINCGLMDGFYSADSITSECIQDICNRWNKQFPGSNFIVTQCEPGAGRLSDFCAANGYGRGGGCESIDESIEIGVWQRLRPRLDFKKDDLSPIDKRDRLDSASSILIRLLAKAWASIFSDEERPLLSGHLRCQFEGAMLEVAVDTMKTREQIIAENE